jgi:hypothetical protein
MHKRLQGSTVKKIFAIVTAIVMALGVALAGEPAQADQADKVKQIIEKLAPGILSQTNSAELLTVAQQAGSSQKQGIRLSSLSSDKKSRISMTVPFASTLESAGSGISVLSGEDDAIRAVSQSTANGFRVLTTLTSSPKSNRFDFKFELPTSVEVQTNANGFLVTDGSRVLGSVAKPWAIDGDGQGLRTHFEWKDSVLTQVLDEALSTITYPVVMDPAWGYIQQYNMSHSPATNMSRLQTCFNCYFPVPGAPRAYPVQGQLLPLRILAIGNFECKMGPTFTGTNYRAFEFFATKNHVDGYGSNITFEFMLVGGQSQLVVSGYVVNDFFTIGQGGYVLGAGATWQIFAINLNSSTPRT